MYRKSRYLIRCRESRCTKWQTVADRQSDDAMWPVDIGNTVSQWRVILGVGEDGVMMVDG